MSIFVDTGAWYAVADRSDRHHAVAASYYRDRAPASDLVTSDLVVAETWTLLRARLGRPAALTFWETLRDLTVTILTLYSVPIHIAVGTASAVGAIVSVPGALGFVAIGWGQAGLPPASVGYVNLAALAAIAPMTALMAPIGARLAHRLPQLWLARIFAGFLGIAAVRMLWTLFD